MATIKKAQVGKTIKKAPKMVPGEMTGKMYKKSEIDEIGRKQAAELDKSGVFGKFAMAKKKAPKAQSGIKKSASADSSDYFFNKSKVDSRKFFGLNKKKGPFNKETEEASNEYVNTLKSLSRQNKKGKPGYDKDGFPVKKQKSGGKTMLKRADGSYSQRGLWDNIRAAKGSGKKPTAAMLKQEKKIKAKTKK